MKTLILIVPMVMGFFSSATAFEPEELKKLIPGYCAERFDQPALGSCVTKANSGFNILVAKVNAPFVEPYMKVAVSICQRELSNADRPGLDIDFRTGGLERFFSCIPKMYTPPSRN